MKGCEKLRTPCSVILRACEEMRTPCSVILSRRSAAKDLQMRCKWLVLRILRSFVVLRFAAATQDDGTICPANFSQPLSRRSAAKDLQMRCRWLVLRNLRSFAVYAAQDDGTTSPAISSHAGSG